MGKILVRILLARHMIAIGISVQRQFMAGTCPAPQYSQCPESLPYGR